MWTVRASYTPDATNGYTPIQDVLELTASVAGIVIYIKVDNLSKADYNDAQIANYMNISESDVKENARLVTIPSHNSKEAIVYSTLTALIIFYARNNMPKEEILKKLNIELKYKPFEKFNSTCSQTFDNCVFAAFNSNSFEESIYKVLSYGGDTDTNACIVGSMAEALYGIDPELIKKAKEYIPKDFIKILDKAYKNRDEVER